MSTHDTMKEHLDSIGGRHAARFASGSLDVTGDHITAAPFDPNVIMASPSPSPRRNHLKVTRSTSNLRVPSVASTAGSPLAHNTEALASSSSSMNNVDMSDRILVPEPEADVDTVIEQQNAVGQMDGTAGDEERKENLRAKLRNTLSRKQSLPGTLRPGSGVPLALASCLIGSIGLIFQMSGFGRGGEGGLRS